MARVLAALTRVAIVSMLYASPVQAALVLSLSSPDDLGALRVGQSATVRVSLSGLATGMELVTLTGSVRFPGDDFGVPASMQAGDIVPNPLANLSDFQVLGVAGRADASFLTASASTSAHMTANGVFYSFQLPTVQVGSGQISLDPIALVAESFVPGAPAQPSLLDVQAGSPLNFTIVPEPGTVMCLLAWVLAGLLHRRGGRSRYSGATPANRE